MRVLQTLMAVCIFAMTVDQSFGFLGFLMKSLRGDVVAAEKQVVKDVPAVLEDKEGAKVKVVQDSPAKVEDNPAKEKVAQDAIAKVEDSPAKEEVIQDSPAKVEDSPAKEEVVQNSPVKFEALKDFPDSLDAVKESENTEEAEDKEESDDTEESKDREESEAPSYEDSDEAADEEEKDEEEKDEEQGGDEEDGENILHDVEQDDEQADEYQADAEQDDAQVAVDAAKDVPAKIEVLKEFPASLDNAEKKKDEKKADIPNWTMSYRSGPVVTTKTIVTHVSVPKVSTWTTNTKVAPPVSDLQAFLDKWCTDLATTVGACATMKYARYFTDKHGGSKRWRCFASLRASRSRSCVNNMAQFVECDGPVTAGGMYCTRDRDIMRLIQQKKEYMGGYKILGGYKTKCAIGLSLTPSECKSAGSILKQLTGKTFKYSKKWKFSMSTRNYGCYRKDGYIWYNTKTSGTSHTQSARSICKAGSIGGSYSWGHKHVRVFVPKSLGCSKSRDGGNWWKSFNHAGWSKCHSGNNYISGFWRSAQGAFWEDRIGRLEEARCCKASNRFQGQVCKNTNWRTSFDKKNHWNSCPKNYYLHGLKKSNGDGLHNIEQAHCCKPTNSRYGKCYTQDITRSFDRKGWSTCLSGYSAVGLYRSSCDKLHCIEKIKCCQMALTFNRWG